MPVPNDDARKVGERQPGKISASAFGASVREFWHNHFHSTRF
jgi:hypothetical protein